MAPLTWPTDDHKSHSSATKLKKNIWVDEILSQKVVN